MVFLRDHDSQDGLTLGFEGLVEPVVPDPDGFHLLTPDHHRLSQLVLETVWLMGIVRMDPDRNIDKAGERFQGVIAFPDKLTGVFSIKPFEDGAMPVGSRNDEVRPLLSPIVEPYSYSLIVHNEDLFNLFAVVNYPP